MKAVVQRVSRAEVRVDGEVVGRIGVGMLVLLGVLRGDDERVAKRLADKLARLRFFPDEDGRWGRSALDVGAEVLVVSQVTLAADGRKGRRPSLAAAADPVRASELYEDFAGFLEAHGLTVAKGVFGALMEVELVNHGPVTFALEEAPR